MSYSIYEKESLNFLVLTSFNYFSIVIPLLGVMFISGYWTH